MNGGARYREVQHLSMWWVWSIIAIIAAIVWWVFLQQVVAGVARGDRPAPDAAVVALWAMFGVAMPAFFAFLRLVVEVDDRELRVSLVPIWTKRVPITEIAECESRTFRPLLEYAGWGIRWTPWSGWAYTISGNRGVQLELVDGGRLLIGSRRSDELAAVVHGIMQGA